MKKNYFPLNKLFIDTPIAHRGLHNDKVSENSLSAFNLAIEKGYAIEIDIHLLKDGSIAVVHDSNLKRVTGHDVIIEDLNKEDLINYPLILNGEKIPLLEEVLSLIDGKVPLLIELKGSTLNKELCDTLLKMLKDYQHKEYIALQSFNHKMVKYLKKHTKEYSVGFLCSNHLGDIKSKFIEKLLVQMELLTYMNADFISFDINFLPNKYVSNKIKKGYQVLTWTINTNEKLDKAKQVADNIIFENINLS